MKPSEYNIEGVKRIEPPYAEANQLKILIPVGQYYELLHFLIRSNSRSKSIKCLI